MSYSSVTNAVEYRIKNRDLYSKLFWCQQNITTYSLLCIPPRHNTDDVAVWGGACLRVPAVPQKDRAVPLLPAFLWRRLHTGRISPSTVREESGQTDEPGVRPRHLHPWTCLAAWVQTAELYPHCRSKQPLTWKYTRKAHINTNIWSKADTCM